MNLKQIKEVHGLKGKNVSYGIVKVTIPGRRKELPSYEFRMTFPEIAEREMKESQREPRTSLHLGLYIKGSGQYFDFKHFRFYSLITLSEVKREIVPARKYRVGENFVFKADDGTELVVSNDYIDNLYDRIYYTKELEENIYL